MVQMWLVLTHFLYFLTGQVQGSVSNMFAVTGTKAVLRCPYISVAPMILAVWNISAKNGMGCLLAYRADTNETKNVNCSERMTWESRPDYDPSLQIHPVKLADEGTYMCEVVNSDGSFYETYALTVFVPPEVTLTYESSGIALCQASAGKPAAHISWVPKNGHSVENKVHHLNGTVTTVSRMYWINSAAINKSCLITHPTKNWTLSIDLSPTFPIFQCVLIVAFSCVAVGVLGGVILYRALKYQASRLSGSAHVPPVANQTGDNIRLQSRTQKIDTVYSFIGSGGISENYRVRNMDERH
ncbi:PREDICTED: cell surface glycoprotein CD200 receptor 2-like [Gavialis gangeticus]|uniref:cell surface glycoprotein CD200 receptor 2-like n=1 Tax=Gavialis gangeticus TaxID=94835 RepID=UPI00092ECCE3|nr:PREDICTED: cell surface glycoprotein CD200 receptor 2-like [Gavialis gangeticus]